jgi:hypothetical protein
LEFGPLLMAGERLLDVMGRMGDMLGLPDFVVRTGPTLSPIAR